jgi:hypothetical protein
VSRAWSSADEWRAKMADEELLYGPPAPGERVETAIGDGTVTALVRLPPLFERVVAVTVALDKDDGRLTTFAVDDVVRL